MNMMLHKPLCTFASFQQTSDSGKNLL